MNFIRYSLPTALDSALPRDLKTLLHSLLGDQIN